MPRLRYRFTNVKNIEQLTCRYGFANKTFPDPVVVFEFAFLSCAVRGYASILRLYIHNNDARRMKTTFLISRCHSRYNQHTGWPIEPISSFYYVVRQCQRMQLQSPHNTVLAKSLDEINLHTSYAFRVASSTSGRR